MNLGSLKPGDRITADVRGAVFEATVDRLERGAVWVTPPRGFSYRRLTARQVRGRLA